MCYRLKLGKSHPKDILQQLHLQKGFAHLLLLLLLAAVTPIILSHLLEALLQCATVNMKSLDRKDQKF